MKQQHLWLFVALLAVGLVIGRQTRAADEGYTLVRGVVSQSSVLTAQGGQYQLQASIGQPFAGAAESGALGLGAGHWYGSGGAGEGDERNLYLPLLSR
jgi:hypothetical protein